MTENKVFEGIHKDCGSLEICNYKETGCGDCPIRQTLINAEKALEEIQQYRAIGTVEEFRADKKIGDKLYKFVKSDVELLDKYLAIGTPDECRSAVERMKPKKPVEPMEDYGTFVCPSCKGMIYTENQLETHKHCLLCGQAIDWSE